MPTTLPPDRLAAALDNLRGRRVSALLKARRWADLADVAEAARLPEAPEGCDALAFRRAVDWFHKAGWARMDPAQIRAMSGGGPEDDPGRAPR